MFNNLETTLDFFGVAKAVPVGNKNRYFKVFSIGITLVDILQNWLNWFHLLFLKGGLLIILIDCMIFLSPFPDITRMSMSTVSFLTRLNSGILCI